MNVLSKRLIETAERYGDEESYLLAVGFIFFSLPTSSEKIKDLLVVKRIFDKLGVDASNVVRTIVDLQNGKDRITNSCTMLRGMGGSPIVERNNATA